MGVGQVILPSRMTWPCKTRSGSLRSEKAKGKRAKSREADEPIRSGLTGGRLLVMGRFGVSELKSTGWGSLR